MSTFSAFIYKQRMRWYGRSVDRRHELRRRLAFYVAKHGFEIGDFSVGEPTIRLYNASRLKVGKYSSVAAGATFILGGNHATEALTTSFLERPKGLGPAKYPYSRGDIIVGSDVWIGANAMVLSGVTIGDGAVIGAGAVVVDDVPPYAIAFGNPARLVRKRFADDVIAALLEVRWWDLPREEIDSLRPLLFGADAQRLLDACGKASSKPPAASTASAGVKPIPRKPSAVAHRGADRGPELARDHLLSLMRAACPAVTPENLDNSFDDLDVDSLGMLTLRTKLEDAMGITVDDHTWSSVATPADVIAAFAQARPEQQRSAEATVGECRVYQLNMPQMAAAGLSESWLFREIGDLHWSQICKGLDLPSSQIRDDDGNRLYATFIRVRVDSSVPLTAYCENESIRMKGQLSRYGSAMFLSAVTVHGEGKSTQARLLSSFSRFGKAATNTALLKGQLRIPPNCRIPELKTAPEFAEEYRAQRAAVLARPLFECEYSIVPYHDINGVGLLYFAAYPIINDICAGRYAGRSYAGLGTLRRDVFYFANCDADDTLIYRLHRWRADEHAIDVEESLSRKSDGALMSYAVTTKAAAAGKNGSPAP